MDLAAATRNHLQWRPWISQGSDSCHLGADNWLSEQIAIGVLRAADIIVVTVAGLCASLAPSSSFENLSSYRFEDLSSSETYVLIIAALILANVFHFSGLYSIEQWKSISRLVVSWIFINLILVVLGFAANTSQEVWRLWVGLWFLFGLMGLLSVRLLFRHRIERWQRQGRLTRKLVVIGAGEHGRRFAEQLRGPGGSSVRIVGMFDDRRTRVPRYVAGHRVLGGLEDLVRFVRKHPVDEVVMALPGAAEGRLLTWIKRLRDLPVDVRLCPDLIGFHLVRSGVTHLSGMPLLNVSDRPLSGWNRVIKAIEDRLIAALILPFVGLLMVMIAVAVRLDSPGPALFRQKRYGYNDEVIEVFKFRTMHVDGSAFGEAEFRQATRHDPRVTRVGRWLRRRSLDELPQLLNVLRGEMSLVGPRPHPLALNEQYAPLIDAYLARHRVKPGITGWAQVNGLRGETEKADKMERRVHHDLYYIENWSLLFDLRILAQTLLVGFAHPNAY